MHTPPTDEPGKDPGPVAGSDPSDAAPAAPDPDLATLEAFRAGDPGAFDDLVVRHQGRILRLARRILRSTEEAQDAAQETFLKAWKALPRFQGKSRFTTWLTRIAINQCRNELRKRGTVKHTRPLSLDEPVPGTEMARRDVVEGDEREPWEHMGRTETAGAWADVLGSLDGEAREVLILKEVEGLSYEDMAEILDVPIGTIRSRLHRARADASRRLALALGEA